MTFHSRSGRDNDCYALENFAGSTAPPVNPPNSETIYQQALDGKQEALDTINSYGKFHLSLNNLEEMEWLYRRALEGYHMTLSSEHPLTLHTKGNLGNLCRLQGKLYEAESLCLQAFEGFEKSWTWDNLWTLQAAHNLGLVYVDQGRLSEAEYWYLKVLNWKENFLGQNHTSTLTTVNNLGLVYEAQRNITAAETMHQRALAGYKEPASTDRWTLESVNSLGDLHRLQGNLDEAQKWYQQVLNGKEQTLGRKHMSTLNTIGNLGNLYWLKGDFQAAETMYKEILSAYEGCPDDDVRTPLPYLNTLENYAMLCSETGQDAALYYERARKGIAVVFGTNSQRFMRVSHMASEI